VHGTILITGGAGFIGSHLADELLARGYAVRVLDDLTPQVHADGGRPEYLDPEVELLVGDVRDADAVARAVEDVEAVVHLAARVGVGQSMYEAADYTDVNARGTAVLLEALTGRPIRRLLVASSMSVYGEGLYRAPDGTLVDGVERTPEQLERGEWELGDLEPVPTPETRQPALASVYAVTKHTQERLCLVFGAAYDIPVTALRLFNTYGPRQALSNPYTGVLAIFASRLLNGRPPLVFEDGRQRRDFVSVSDVAHAFRLALESDSPGGEVLNVGSGESVTVLDVAEKLAEVLGVDIPPQPLGRRRAGDVRHCFADVTRAREVLGYEPQVPFETGLRELAEWLPGRVAVDRVDAATEELSSRGLL
jgi:dTDP-L-rhamnose 4-epimerase